MARERNRTAAACRAALKFIEVAGAEAGSAAPTTRAIRCWGPGFALYWKNESEHLVASISSEDPAAVSLHWEVGRAF